MDHTYKIGTLLACEHSLYSEFKPTIGVITEVRRETYYEDEEEYEESGYYIQWQDGDEGWFTEGDIEHFIYILRDIDNGSKDRPVSI